MDLPAEDAETIAVSAFKPRSLELIERVASGRVGASRADQAGSPGGGAVAGARSSRSSCGVPCAT